MSEETRASVQELIARYELGVSVLRDSVEGLSAAALRERPIAGKLSSLEVLCHVVDSDQFMCDRMKRTIATERPLIIGVESIDYPGPLAYHERDPQLDLELLRIQREQMVADLKRLPAEAWSRSAIHSEVGLVTLYDLFEHAVDHLESHVATIAEKRTAMGL